MKKFLDILLIVLLTLLIVNLFSDKKQKILDHKLIINFVDDNYSIPASLWVEVINNTVKPLTINTCKDLLISYAWENIKFDKEFCNDIIIESWKNNIIDYASQYDKFNDIWKYNLKINIWEKDFFDQTELEHSWTFVKIFVGLFYAPIYNLMIWLLSLFWWVFGLAIIFITIIIRIVLLYPQHKMMVSQKKLQAIQPKVKEIQNQYKANQQMLWMKLMELYKKEKVNPMWSCGFLLIQMPILLVIYNIILSIKDPSNFFYTYSFLSSFDLLSINYEFIGLNLLESWWIAGWILAITVWIIQFLQIRLSLADKLKTNKTGVVLEKKKGESNYSQFMPDPDMMNKFMLYWMPTMVAVFTFVLFTWVWIYWGISTLFMLFQQLFVNKVLKKK
jgi:YidC/Oxa1 family membrane protein insertase